LAPLIVSPTLSAATLPVSRSEHLPNLTQLTLEDNALRSLAGLSTLQHLLELYVGNNQV
jgi:Leucine-rich repeat (LRR) protein